MVQLDRQLDNEVYSWGCVSRSSWGRGVFFKMFCAPGTSRGRDKHPQHACLPACCASARAAEAGRLWTACRGDTGRKCRGGADRPAD